MVARGKPKPTGGGANMKRKERRAKKYQGPEAAAAIAERAIAKKNPAAARKKPKPAAGTRRGWVSATRGARDSRPTSTCGAAVAAALAWTVS